MTRRRPTLDAVREAEALREADRAELLRSLARHAADVPCVAGDVLPPAAWTSDDHGDLELAAVACRTCPLLDACAAYGRRWPEEWGTYGGRTQQQRQSAATTPRRTP